MPLLVVCERVTCRPEETCREGACVDARIAPGSLASIEEPGRELSDAGARADAGTRPDAAGPDAARGDGGACDWGVPTPVVDEGTDWDPTTTQDDLLLVWSIDSRLQYATRSGPGEMFMWRGPLPITELMGMDVVSPALSADGSSIVVVARVGGTGPESLFELTRSSGYTFSSPRNIAMNMEVTEPGLDATGEHLVAIAGSQLVTATRARVGDEFTPAMGRIAEELDPYLPKFPALSADGLTVAFTSGVARPSDDIFLAHRDTVDAAFDTPVPLDEINDPGAEDQDPWLAFDGNAIYFTSDRLAPTLVWDIFVSRRSCP
jgi:hypothetical protein